MIKNDDYCKDLEGDDIIIRIDVKTIELMDIIEI